MRVVVQQTQFLPWAGLWAKVLAAELYVVYAGVKFNAHTNENRVSIADNVWLTLPVAGGQRTALAKDVRLAGSLHDYQKMVRTIQQMFQSKKNPYRDRLDPVVSLLSNVSNGQFLLDVNQCLMEIVAGILGIKTTMEVDVEDRSHMEKLEKLHHTLTAHARGVPYDYYMGRGGLNYMGFNDVPEAGEVRIQKMHPSTSPHSILQVIAQHPNPIEVVEAASAWEGPKGDLIMFKNGKPYVTQDFA